MSDIAEEFLNHERHNYIRFFEEPHEYYYYPSGDFRKTSERVQFYGITGWIGEYCSKFNAEKQAKASSKNPRSEWYGLDPEVIKKAWSAKGRQSANKGSAIHKSIEDVVNLGTYDDEKQYYIDSFWELMDEHGIKPISAETVVYDEDIKRATAIDIMGVKDNKLIPLDIKTFEDGMKYTSYGNRKMKYPLDHLMESKFEKVSLQISIEREMLLRKYNLETDDGFCILLNDTKCELIPVMSYLDEVKQMYERI